MKNIYKITTIIILMLIPTIVYAQTQEPLIIPITYTTCPFSASVIIEPPTATTTPTNPSMKTQPSSSYYPPPGHYPPKISPNLKPSKSTLTYTPWSPHWQVFNNLPIPLTPYYNYVTAPPNKGVLSDICLIEYDNITYTWNKASSLNIINSTVTDINGTPTIILHSYSTYIFQAYQPCILIFKI